MKTRIKKIIDIARSRCRTFATCAVLVSLSTAGACDILDPCGGLQSRCNGNVLETCQQDDDLQSPAMTSTPCVVACVEPSPNNAFCADSQTPIDECANVALDGTACWNNSITTCNSGYPTRTESSCGDATCTLTPDCESGAVCAVGPALANCDQPAGTCLGDGMATCTCGYPVATSSCGDGTCVLDATNMPQCTLTSTPDPRCGPVTRIYSAFCADNVAYRCVYGYPVRQNDCASMSMVCVLDASQDDAECESASSS